MKTKAGRYDKFLYTTLVISAIGMALLRNVEAQTTIAKWTFENWPPWPTAHSAYSPEFGNGLGGLAHASTLATYNHAFGNGSAKSLNSSDWAVGDCYLFKVSTRGFLGISVSFDQASTYRGPRDFSLQYSMDGRRPFTPIASYSVLQAGVAPNAPWNATTPSAVYTFSSDLSALTQIDNQYEVWFRLVNTSSISVDGGSVIRSGYNRIDNVTVVAASVVPEPATATVLGIGLAGLLVLRRRS